MTTTPPRAVVEKRWPGATVVCLGTGPSLTQADVDACRGRARVIAINDAYTLAPWADALFAGDAKWWGWHPDAAHFAGLKVAFKSGAVPDLLPSGVVGLRVAGTGGREGLSTDPTALASGYSSGYAAIGLAYHLGACRVILLGYDMKDQGRRAHFFGDGNHPDGSKPPFLACLKAFERLVAPAAAAGLEIVNCTRSTDLRCFPMAALSSVLTEVAA